MKNLTAVLIIGLIIAFVSSCGGGQEEQPAEATPTQSGMGVTQQEVKEQIDETLETVKQYTWQKKEEYKKHLQSQLENINNEISELKKKSQEMSEDAQKEMQQTIERLEKKMGTVQSHLNKLENVTKDSWEELKKTINDTMNEVEKTYQNLEEKHGTSDSKNQ